VAEGYLPPNSALARFWLDSLNRFSSVTAKKVHFLYLWIFQRNREIFQHNREKSYRRDLTNPYCIKSSRTRGYRFKLTEDIWTISQTAICVTGFPLEINNSMAC
jgi:hypothetical protein